MAILNIDVIEAIFDFIYPDESDPTEFDWVSHYEQRDYKSRANLCLVSKACLAPARRILYQVVSPNLLNRAGAFDALKATPDLRVLARRLYFNSAWFTDPASPHLNCIEEILPLLPQCTILARLDYADINSGIWECLLTSRRLSHVALADSSMKYVQLRNYDGWDQIFGSWHSLTELRIAMGSSKFYPAQSEPTNHDLLSSLRSLKLRYLRGDWFTPLPTCENTIHTLALHNCLYINRQAVVEFIRRQAQSLRRISISLISWTEDENPRSQFLHDIVTIAEGVEELYIHTPHLPNGVFQYLPTSLTSLSLTIYASDTTVSECLDYIRQLEGSKNLRSVTLEIWIGDTQTGAVDELKEKWSQVYDEAEQKGIIFSCICAKIPDIAVAANRVVDEKLWVVGTGKRHEIRRWEE
jgi:hypothetical protein